MSGNRSGYKCWLLLTEVTGNIARYPNYYASLHSAFPGQLLEFERLIWLDVERTSPFLIPDQKATLHRILFAFVKRNMEVSYCQGMNFLANFFLSNGFGEEEIFWIICHLLEQTVSLSYYINLIPVFVDVEIMTDMLKEMHPDLVSHVSKCQFDLNFILIPLMVTLLSSIKNQRVK